PGGFGVVDRRVLLRLGLDLDLDRLALGPLGRFDQLDALVALGHFGLARGHHLLLGGDRLGPRLVGLGLGLAFLAALVLHRDLLLLAGDLDRLDLGDARLLDRAVGLDLLRVDVPLGLDPRGFRLAVALGLLARDFGRLLGA